MSTRGRKAELKAIDGGLKGVPQPPKSVPESMIAEWNAIGADMAERQILTTPALGLLESYLIARWSAQEAQKAIAEHGVLTETAHKMLKPNPANGLLSKSLEAVARLGAELGISPASRSKGQFKPKGGQDDKGAPSGLAI